MAKKLLQAWLSLSEANRKRIVSFLRVFLATFAAIFAAQMNLGFPESWAAAGALMSACASSALKEAIDAFVRSSLAGRIGAYGRSK